MTKQDTSLLFRTGDFVVYPAHGVGKVIGEEKNEIAGNMLHFYIISFDKDKMTLKVPVARAESAGLRLLSSEEQLDKAMAILSTRPKVGRGMWSKRAQEYENKINSGDLSMIAEVVRDLYRNSDIPERSYSERMIYETALNRLVSESAAMHDLDEQEATKKVISLLAKRANDDELKKQKLEEDENSLLDDLIGEISSVAQEEKEAA